MQARVSGSYAANYAVNLSWDGPDSSSLQATCTCPYFTGGNLCKHIWATLLAVNDHSKSSSEIRAFVSRIDPATVAVDAAPDEDLGDDGHFPNDSVAGSKSRGATQMRHPAWTVPTQFGWKQALAPARTVSTTAAPYAPSPPQRREALYVLNVTSSLEFGKLWVEFFQREENRHGEFGTCKRFYYNPRYHTEWSDPTDRMLLDMLVSKANHPGSYYNTYDASNVASTSIAPEMHDVLLPKMCQTGRFVWLLDSDLSPDVDGQPVNWDDGPAWQFQLQIDTDDEAQAWHLGGKLYRDGETAELQEPVLLLAVGLVLFPDRLCKLDAAASFPWIVALRSGDPVTIPYSDREEFLDFFFSLPDPPKCELPESLRLETIAEPPVGKLVVRAPSRFERTDRSCGDVAFVYADATFELSDRRPAIRDGDRLITRNRDGETSLLRELEECGVHTSPYGYANAADVQFTTSELLSIVRDLTSRGWIVEAEGRRVRSPGNFNLSVKSGTDWFELDGGAEFDGVGLSLPRLLQALRNNEKYVRLDDGSQGILPEHWLDKYGGLADLGKTDGDAVKFSQSQALLLDALLSAQDNVTFDNRFHRFRDKLRQFSGVDPKSEPRGFQGELRPYQRDGLGWLNFLQSFGFGGCLADDMGLGKTIQVLALLEARRTRRLRKDEQRLPSIVVVPKSLVFNWIDEAQRFTPKLQVLDYTGSGRQEHLDSLDQYHLLITTYGTLRRDIIALKEIPFDYAILDEAQAIKNGTSQAAKASRLLNATHRLAMTGTPVENHLGELWSMFEFLNPGMLGNSTTFNAMTKRGINSEGIVDGGVDLLAKGLRPFMLRRTKEQVLTDLPEKTEQTLYCDMLPKQRKLYDELRDYYRSSLSKRVKEVGIKRAKIHVLEALLRLRQAACHPGLVDSRRAKDPSAKLDVLMEQLQEVIDEGHKALVFSQFTSLLSIVRKKLDRQKIVYEYLDGQTRDRAERVQRFQQDEDCPLFLISLKAGGHGLNLTAADYVFILDPWWNPAVEAQAIDRAHRIGQQQHVFAYRIICRDTVEEKILELQRSKRELADAIVSADNSLIRNLSADDLTMLLS